jgi:hypothetical protein
MKLNFIYYGYQLEAEIKETHTRSKEIKAWCGDLVFFEGHEQLPNDSFECALYISEKFLEYKGKGADG